MSVALVATLARSKCCAQRAGGAWGDRVTVRSRGSLRFADGEQPGGDRMRASVRRRPVDELHVHAQPQDAQMLERADDETIRRRLAGAVG
jgi:hypothetical protein